MQHDDLVYLGHMFDSGKLAARKGREATREQFLADDNLQLALTHLVQIVGEAARKVSPGFRAKHPEVPWVQIVGMRHRVVHDYVNTNVAIVWSVVTEELPKLIAQLAAILNEPLE